MKKKISNVDKVLPYIDIIDGKLFYKGNPRTIPKKFNNIAFWLNGKVINCNINGILIEYYNLKPPDTYHYYDLIRKNKTDLSLNNLSWERRLLKDYKYRPELFYKNGKICSKICGECGEKLPISRFKIQIEKYTKNGTLRNVCERCRYNDQYAKLKKDPIKVKKLRDHQTKWSNSEVGKKYHSDYARNWRNFEKSILSKRYASNLLHMSVKDITDDLYELTKKRYLLRKSISK